MHLLNVSALVLTADRKLLAEGLMGVQLLLLVLFLLLVMYHIHRRQQTHEGPMLLA